MANVEALAAQVARLQDLEDIKTMKYQYFRAMTFGDDALKEAALTADVVTSCVGRGLRLRRSGGAAALPDRLPRSRRRSSVTGWPACRRSPSSPTEAGDLGHVPLLLRSRARVRRRDVRLRRPVPQEDGVWKMSKTGHERVINQILDRREIPTR
ncbi:MAG: hypothetical protein R3E53_21360 [Myxococcota bacterium]